MTATAAVNSAGAWYDREHRDKLRLAIWLWEVDQECLPYQFRIRRQLGYPDPPRDEDTQWALAFLDELEKAAGVYQSRVEEKQIGDIYHKRSRREYPADGYSVEDHPRPRSEQASALLSRAFERSDDQRGVPASVLHKLADEHGISRVSMVVAAHNYGVEAYRPKGSKVWWWRGAEAVN